jgi:hypothetical protein
VIVANRSCAPSNFTLSGLTGDLRNLETNQTFAVGDQLSLAAGDGAMFELTAR